MTDNNYEYLGKPKHGTIVGHSDQSAWEKAAGHRAHVLRLLQRKGSERKGIIGVFGVGDGTSLELQALLKRFHEVHLIDRDPALIRQIVQDQKLDDRHRIFQHAHDIGGAHDLLEQFQSDPTDERFAEIYQAIGQHSFPDSSRLPQFNVTLSLSQIPELTNHASRCISDADKLVDVVTQLRRRHIELMLDQTIASGTVIMLVDIVSSKTIPHLEKSPEDLPAILEKARDQRNYFPGTLPATFHLVIEEFKDRFADGNVTHPWIRQAADEFFATVGWQLVLNAPSDET